MIQEGIAIKHNHHRFEFSLANVAASQDGTAVPRNANGNVYVMPWDGHIVQLAAALTAAVTQGTLTLIPTLNGVEQAFTLGFDATANPQFPRRYQDVEITRFSAGDRLGMNYDSSANLLPTGSADLNAEVYVVFENVEF